MYHNLDKEVFFIHVVSDVQIHQVDELGAVFQVVNHQDVGDAFVIESFRIVPGLHTSKVTVMIIVTGGAGFIGSNIVKALNDKGITDILVVDNLKDGTKFVNLVDPPG